MNMLANNSGGEAIYLPYHGEDTMIGMDTDETRDSNSN